MPLMSLMTEFPSWRDLLVFTQQERNPLLLQFDAVAVRTNGLKVTYQDVLSFRVRHVAACTFVAGVFGGEVFIFVFAVIKIPLSAPCMGVVGKSRMAVVKT